MWFLSMHALRNMKLCANSTLTISWMTSSDVQPVPTTKPAAASWIASWLHPEPHSGQQSASSHVALRFTSLYSRRNSVIFGWRLTNTSIASIKGIDLSDETKRETRKAKAEFANSFKNLLRYDELWCFRNTHARIQVCHRWKITAISKSESEIENKKEIFCFYSSLNRFLTSSWHVATRWNIRDEILVIKR